LEDDTDAEWGADGMAEAWDGEELGEPGTRGGGGVVVVCESVFVVGVVVVELVLRMSMEARILTRLCAGRLSRFFRGRAEAAVVSVVIVVFLNLTMRGWF